MSSNQKVLPSISKRATGLQVELLRRALEKCDVRGMVQLRDLLPFSMQSYFDHSNSPVLIVSAIAVDSLMPKVKIVETSTGNTDVVAQSGTNLEVTGNPLETPFSAEDKDLIENPGGLNGAKQIQEHEKFLPLPSDKASMVQMMYAKGVEENKKKLKLTPEDFHPVIYLCDGIGGMKKVLMHQYSLTHKRGFAAKEEKCSEQEMMPLRQKAQTLCVAQAGVKTKNPKVDVFRYLEHSIDNSSESQVLPFKLRTVWKELGTDLDSNPPRAAACTLETVLSDNWETWFLGDLAEEVMFLRELAARLGNKDEPLNPVSGGPEYLDVVNSADEIVELSRVDTRTSVDVSFSKKESNDELTLKILLNDTINGVRPNCDLTDCIWNVLKYCSTVNEVSSGMIAVLQKCVETQPSILPNNKTYLANAAQNLRFRGEDTKVFLNADPVALLLEVGYVKLCRDFGYILQGSGLKSSIEDALAACGAENSENIMKWNGEEWEKKVSLLFRFMCCLEIVFRASEQFAFKLRPIKSVLNSALNSKIGETVRVNLNAEDFSHHLQSSEAGLRRWTFHCTNLSGGHKQTCKTQFLVRQSMPFFHWASPISEHQADSTLLADESDIVEYYCATVHNIDS